MHQSFYSSQANSFLVRFTDLCKDLRHITEASARRVMVAELIDLYADAQEFYEDHQDKLNHIALHQMTHLLARPLKEHLVLTKSSINLISNDSR